MALFSRRAAPSTRASVAVTGITDAERDWIEAHVALVSDAGVDIADAEQLRRCYEQWSAGWRRINPPERDDPAVRVNAIGAAFGEHVVRRTTLLWGLVEDQDGVDLVLYRDRHDVLVRPVSLVASRWAAEEPSGEFLIASASQLATTLSGVRRGRRARPGESSGRGR